MFGGIETGGTKTVCATGRDGTLTERAEFPTGDDPLALTARIAGFFAGSGIEALGVGTFGPCDPDPQSPTYGWLLDTPKPGWSRVDLLGLLGAQIDVPMTMTTDVGAAAVGELRYGAGQGIADLVYLTIGTGVGGGVISDGRLIHGDQHPEVGHMLLPFAGPGVCPFHANCWEGLASGPAFAHRLGHPAALLADDDPAWEEQARITTAGLHNLACALSPQVFIIGGGVGSRAGLHRLLPGYLEESLAGYIRPPGIAVPALGPDAGVIGALTVAEERAV